MFEDVVITFEGEGGKLRKLENIEFEILKFHVNN